LVGPELAVYVFEKLARNHVCFFPSRLIVGKFFSDIVPAGIFIVNVEKVAWHLAIPHLERVPSTLYRWRIVPSESVHRL